MACNKYSFFQWNCRGLRGSREEIELLINEYSPAAICLQETMLKQTNEPTFKNHHTYYSSTLSGSGGVALIVKDTFLHSKIDLKTNLQAVAVRITIGQRTYSLCSIYIPPPDAPHIKINDLKDLRSQLKSPAILMGDFNCHNGFWGATHTDDGGNVLGQFVLEEDLILFNNKHHTYFRNDYSSLLDLTLCDPSVFMDFNCIVHENTHGSDHSPIQLAYNDPNLNENERTPQWNFKKANWALFKELCVSNITADCFIENSNDMTLFKNDKMATFTDLLLSNAITAIPTTSPNPKKKPKPYFDDECKNLINKRNAAYKKYRENSALQNIRHYQLLRAKCRRTIKRKKQSSWRQYVSSINSFTPMKKVWERIAKINGKNRNKLVHHLKDENGELITSKEDIADALGKQFQKCSSSDNYTHNFKKIKTKAEENPIDFSTNENLKYNKKFKMRDLKYSIKK